MAERDKTIDVTNAEWQLIESLREWDQLPEGYQISIERVAGAWSTALREVGVGTGKTARGTGASFDEAWHNLEPNWERQRHGPLA